MVFSCLAPATVASPAVFGAPVGRPTDPAACHSNVRYSPLPTWARAGFQPPGTPMSHVIGAQGDIVAILWAKHDPLLSPPSPDRRNKILWVARVGAGTAANLQIEARRIVGTSVVGPAEKRTVAGGPGPSGIDMPSPGCWRFTLRWSGHVDHLDLQYAADR